MAVDFQDMVAGLPGLKDLTAAARDGLTERVLMRIAGAHRWPFLLRVQQSFTWAASDAIQTLTGVSRIWNIMYPDSSGDYYRLTELSDIEFQNWIEQNPDSTTVDVWRDAGLDGSDQQIEIYAVPSSATTLKVDYTMLPSVNDIDDMPGRFQDLVVSGMMAMIGNYGAKVAFRQDLQDAIAREQDLQGKRSHVGMDPIQASRMRGINSPS